jgi:hypothetical protein
MIAAIAATKAAATKAATTKAVIATKATRTRTRTTALPLDIMQFILSYLHKELYEDRNNMTHFRFISKIYENMFGHLYQNVTFLKDVFVKYTVQYIHITRPNVVCSSVCHYNYPFHEVEPICDVTYYFNGALPSDEYNPKKTHAVENYTYFFK